jgi:hypothetical protein
VRVITSSQSSKREYGYRVRTKEGTLDMPWDPPGRCKRSTSTGKKPSVYEYSTVIIARVRRLQKKFLKDLHF